MKKLRVFFLILGLVASGILLVAADFGESSASLGQFTDDFTDLNNVSVRVSIIRNATLNAMEINSSIPIVAIQNLTSLREHDYFGAAATPGFTFTINNNDEIRMISTTASQGRGYMFLTVDRNWLDDKYVRFRYYPFSDVVLAVYQKQYFEVYDGTYDRSNNADFPSAAGGAPWNPIPTKGNGVLFSYTNVDGLNNWFIKDFQVDTSGGSEDNVTLFWWMADDWSARTLRLQLDWIEINDGAGGADPIILINFNNSSPITMEQIGTQGDYGFSLNPELPLVVGGFESEGYFITTDYLASLNGSVLTQLTNATIPGGTSITAQFSPDNSTWVDAHGAPGATPITAGYLATDLRDLNWSTSHYVKYNMTGGDDTPRLYQSRLISTVGEVGAGAPGQNVSRETVFYNLTEIGVTVGTLDSGDLNSTLDIDGDMYNVSELVGAPGMQISGNFSGVDPDAGCLWVVIYAHYDGNLNHDFDIEVWNFTSSAWVEDSHITDGIELAWFNTTIYALRIPNEFLSGGEVRVRLDHEAPGNINHDLFIEYFKLLAEIPAGPTPGAGAVTVNIIESDFPWIAIAIILMCVAYLLFRPK